MKTSKGQYSFIIIVPPVGNRIRLLCTNSNIPCSICTKLHMFGKSPGLKTSTCQCSVIRIAPPAGSRKFGTYNDFEYSSYIYYFKSILPTVCLFLKPPVSGEPGCEVPFIAACSFNYLGTEHRWCEDPIESALFIIIIIIIIIILFFFSKQYRIFEGLTCSKSHETLHRLRTGEN